MGCGRVETGGDRSLDSRRFSFFIVLIRVGVVNPPAATSLGRQALQLLHQPGWGVPEGILINFAHLWTGCCKIGSLFLQPSEVQCKVFMPSFIIDRFFILCCDFFMFFLRCRCWLQ
jgi:hypothetical protein